MTNKDFKKLEIKNGDNVFAGNSRTSIGWFGTVKGISKDQNYNYELILDPQMIVPVRRCDIIKKIENLAQEVFPLLNGLIGPVTKHSEKLTSEVKILVDTIFKA